MARKLRVQYPGAIYQVMNRGDRRKPIFKDDADYERFPATLGEACLKTGWQVHAYCLMPNHSHLAVETSQANLVSGMKWFLGTYTSRSNRRHKLLGHLFSRRYKSLIVDGSGTGCYVCFSDRTSPKCRRSRWRSCPRLPSYFRFKLSCSGHSVMMRPVDFCFQSGVWDFPTLASYGRGSLPSRVGVVRLGRQWQV